jgi:transcriptional regulator with XRE-family HTH domain
MASDNPRRTKFSANFVGPQIRKLRVRHGWSQAKLAERLQLNGLDIGREAVAQIEAQTHCVKDKDLLYFAHALKVNLADLFFGEGGRRSMIAIIAQLQQINLSKLSTKNCNEIITTRQTQNW